MDPGVVAVIVALIAGVPAAILAGGGLVAARAARTAAAEASQRASLAQAEMSEARSAIIATKDGVFELGKRVDGRLEELLEATRSSAEAKGIAAGVAQERAYPQGPRGEWRAGRDGPVEVVGVADPDAEPVRTADHTGKGPSWRSGYLAALEDIRAGRIVLSDGEFKASTVREPVP